MLTITAIIRARPGTESTMRDALLQVVAHVQANEPGTIGYSVAQDHADPQRFVTHERYVDQAAMDRHNESAAVAAFFAIAKPILDGEVVLVTGREIAAKA